MMSKNMKSIHVAPYDENWPRIFLFEATQIKDVLGANCVNIYHVGSTSVPGLSSKARIDIVVEVNCAEETLTPLTKIGYTSKGEWNTPFKWGFSKRQTNEVNLHVYEKGHAEIEVSLVFRNYLRSHTDRRDQYARLKEDLLKNPQSYEKQENSMFTRYTLGKADFIAKILKEANYQGNRFLRVTYPHEWADYKQIFLDKTFQCTGIQCDKSHKNFTDPHYHNFILTRGILITSIIQIQFWRNDEVIIRMLATAPSFQKQGFGTIILKNAEKWIAKEKKTHIYLHARKEAIGFYEKLGYQHMPFDDTPLSAQNVVDMGKILL